MVAAAVWIASFLFLCWVSLIVLVLVWELLHAIFKG